MPKKIDGLTAIEWIQKGDSLELTEAAIQCYNKALMIDSKKINAWNRKATALHKLGRLDLAIQCYDKSLQLDLNNKTAWIGKGEAQWLMGWVEESIKSYDKALQIDVDDIKAWLGKGNALRALNKYKKALDCYDKVINKIPKHFKALLGKGKSLVALEKDLDALECFNTIPMINATNKEVLLLKIEILDRFLKTNPEKIDFLFQKADILSTLEQIGEAINCYNKILDRDALNISALVGKARNLEAIDHFEAALDIYEEALKIVLEERKNYSKVDPALNNLDWIEDAIKLFDKVILTEPQKWISKIIALNTLGRTEEAVDLCDKIIGISSDSQKAFPGWKIILKTMLKEITAFDLKYFFDNRESYEKWARFILNFNQENKKFPTKKEIWILGIPMDQIESVIQYLNLKISTEILSNLKEWERSYFDTLSQKVVAHLTAHELDALRLEELVLKLNLKIRDAKILIPFINEVLERDIKIEP